MTDEEMAEKKYCNGCKWRIEQCLWAWRKTNGLNEPNEKNCTCKEVPAFLAGLKAGRPQWHKVADGDLPKGDCLVFYKDTSGENSYSIVHPSWYIAGIKAFFENNPRIIAWCEIPTIDKE